MSQAAAPRQNRKPLRALLLALPAFMLVAAFTLITLSPTVWPPAEEASYPRWVTTASALVMAVVGGGIGIYALRQVYLRTLGDFEVMGIQVYFGVVALGLGGLLLFNWVPLLRFLQDVSQRDVSLGAQDDGPGALGFIAVTLVGLFALAVVWCGTYIYVNALSNTRPNALTLRRPDEVDGVGRLLEEGRRVEQRHAARGKLEGGE